MTLKKGDLVRYLGGDPNVRGNLTKGKIYEITNGNDGIVGDNNENWYIGRELGNTDCFVKVFGELPDEEFAEEPTQDAVNSPQHYKRGKYETIEVIEHITAGYDYPFVAYCVGNAVKYLDRAPYKHDSPAECLRKAAWYITRAAEHTEASE